MNTELHTANIELLAPAGGPAAGYAALHFGADAVYAGLGSFSARAYAANFTAQELADFVGYAHSLPRRRKVYVTVNTLILQSELDALVETVSSAAEAGIDAIIAQDLGVVFFLKRHFPALAIHASTQMAVHNRAGALAAFQMGLRRVTLARELTLEEIKTISARPGPETEVFVHGALCYSYSGLCLFSSHLCGRSGNRGKCAYPCRDAFGPKGAPPDRFPFSMKDLALPGLAGDLRRAGIAALKIEGRMKSPLYVAAAVRYYRAMIDRPEDERAARQAAADLRTVFSRPWTELYLRGRKGRNVIDSLTQGHRGCPAGRVEKTVDGGPAARFVRFRTTLPLELHDGLQIDLPGLPRPFGFAVKNIRLAAKPGQGGAKSVFTAPAGALVEIALPPDHPPIPAGSTIYASSSQRAKREYRYPEPKPGLYRPRHKVFFKIAITAGGFEVSASVEITADHAGGAGPSARRRFPAELAPAKSPGAVEEACRAAFQKLGATSLVLAGIDVSNPHGLFVPASVLNAARREIATELEQGVAAFRRDKLLAMKDALSSEPGTVAGSPPRACTPIWSVKTDQPDLLAGFAGAEWRELYEVILELSAGAGSDYVALLEELGAVIGRHKIRLALPAVARGWEMDSLAALAASLVSAGWRKWQVANLGGLATLNSGGCPRLDLSADWPLYALNRLAVLQLAELGMEKFTLSPEDGIENMRLLLREFGARATVVVYQDTPLMVSETAPECPADPAGGGRARILVSEHGEEIEIISRNGRAFVLDSRPYCLGARLPELMAAGASSFRMDFINRRYSCGEALEVWRTIRANRRVGKSREANFSRGLS